MISRLFVFSWPDCKRRDEEQDCNIYSRKHADNPDLIEQQHVFAICKATIMLNNGFRGFSMATHACDKKLRSSHYLGIVIKLLSYGLNTHKAFNAR